MAVRWDGDVAAVWEHLVGFQHAIRTRWDGDVAAGRWTGDILMYLEAMHIRFLLVGGIACREKDSFRCFDILCIHKSCSWEGGSLP